MLISIKTHITCDFPEGSGPPVPPLDPRMFEQSLPLDVRKSIQSPRHCNSRFVKVTRVPSLPLEVSRSIQSSSHFHKSSV